MGVILKMANKYIFVVCGGDEHIQTLNFSLNYLKKYSDKEIVVLTDLSRNKLVIDHDNIIDVKTPEKYNHHQASIYLKTGIHKFIIPEEDSYCYLDTDVIAIRKNCDTIFEKYNSPISFCSDHCKMQSFSPHAVYSFEPNKRNLYLLKQLRKSKVYHTDKNCEINKNNLNQGGVKLKKQESELASLLKEYNNLKQLHISFIKEHPYLVFCDNAVIKTRIKIANYQKYKNKIQSIILINIQILKRLSLKFRVGLYMKLKKINLPVLPDFKSFFQSKGYFWDEEQDLWKNNKEEILYDMGYINRSVQEDTGLVWNRYTSCWEDADGLTIQESKSDTLKEEILKNFNVNITEPNWQHWNGGVFIFNKDSIPFLNTWHEWTLKMFDNPKWQTRDQGTLIATAWKFDLENHPLLPVEYDFIADYHHPTMQYKRDLVFDINAGKQNIKPYFVHIYHHFGDKDWELWQDVEKLLGLSLEAH